MSIEKDFLKINMDINHRIKRVVGNGANIRFWIGHWVGDNPLRMQFPNIFKIVKSKLSTVADCSSIFGG